MAKAKVKKAQKALVIVESPAKCKTIKKILGENFLVEASMGHVIDLPKSKMGVDTADGFKPHYIVVAGKRKVLTHLKKSLKGRDLLYLACDPDREGEAISWHLSRHLGEGKEVARVTFNEITPQAIREAFERPRPIDMNLVGAQQARRILDRIVGYSLSPLLWKKIARGLSAGRVQSVALRLIVDQERKIQAFVPEEYWTVEALVSKLNSQDVFTVILEKKGEAKLEIKNKQEAGALSSEIRKGQFQVEDVKISERRKIPPPPFITSKLQQEAFNRLRMRPARTMMLAQSLYEGVDLGSGDTIGLITYMRTDSVNVSPVAVSEVREFIQSRYGAHALPAKPNVYKSKTSAQEAHEAIRPTSVARTPQSLRGILNDEELSLYELIWQRFVGSQMKPALYEQISVQVKNGPYLFKATGSRLIFKGYLEAAGLDDISEKDHWLPELKAGEKLNLVELKEEQHFTKPPARFTEASLVKMLEERGIGRPSTYAPIVQTIVGREYVERQGGALIPTELGFLVVDILIKHFPKLMDVDFTALMEEELDHIEEGRREWADVLAEFYRDFEKNLATAQLSVDGVKKKEEATNEVCELCQRPMVIKWGRRGKFLSCSGFPECKNARSISTDVVCPACKEGKLVARRARSGRGRRFFGCTRYPTCTFIAQKLPDTQSSSAADA